MMIIAFLCFDDFHAIFEVALLCFLSKHALLFLSFLLDSVVGHTLQTKQYRVATDLTYAGYIAQTTRSTS